MFQRDYAYLGDGVGLARTHRDHKIFVSTRDFGLTPHIILRGIWERWIEDAVVKMTPRGGIVAEVGCNMGYHTLAMAQKIGPKGRLIGFEANPEMHKLLHATITLNGFSSRCDLRNLAATEHEDTYRFQFDSNWVGGGNIIHGEPAPGNTVIDVPGVPLDAQLGDIPALDLLRMDAEGFEPFVIRGARNIIERSPDIVIIMEWSTGMMAPRTDLGVFVAEMRDMGFKSWQITRKATLAPMDMDSLTSIAHSEIVFSRKTPPT